MNNWLPLIEESLTDFLSVPDMPYRQVMQAMAYSAQAGGKRLRPVLTLEFCHLLGGDVKKALPFACAVEMIHTYSLIHDDLPCMDNDDMRRGRPSCHREFDEATALLAGDGLLTKAFELLATAEQPPEAVVAAVKILAGYAGPEGMVGGQAVDLESEKKPPTETVLELTYRLKTAALLQAACKLGVLCGGGGELELQKASEYAYHLGMAFQIIDDVLDVTGDQATLGKPIGSDAQNGKVTFVTILGLSDARELAAKYSQSALRALTAFDQYPGAEDLTVLTEQLLIRKK